MIGLQEFKELDHTRHNPAIGKFYGKGPLGRLLITGMSHYGEEKDVRDPEFTNAVVSQVIDGERKIPYFTKIAGLFRDPDGNPYAPRGFYPLVAFYNFLPDVFLRAGQRVTEEQWLNENTQRFFFRVVDDLKPERILVTGEELWRVLPSRLPGQQASTRVSEDGTGLHVQFGGVEAECCWYHVKGAEDCLVGAITHPSTPKFIKNRADISEWVQKFMICRKGIPAPSAQPTT